MRVQGAKKVHYDSGPNMTPLVDVVMVILIFLMLAGSFGGAEQYLTSNMPVKASGPGLQTPTDKKTIPDEPLEIRVDSPMRAMGDDSEAESFLAKAGQIQTASADALREELKKMKAKMNAAGTTTDKIQVVIAPNRFVKYKSLISVYQAALEAEFTKVAFSTAH